jgi:predicted GIY-YIG superfamily endonuclease
MNSNIYILELENDKFYIGKTNNVKDRFKEHLNGIGNIWTKNNKPKSIIKTIENCSLYDLDEYVKEYMKKYGIDNVRGGSYNQIILNTDTITYLYNELNMCCYSSSKEIIRLDNYVNYFDRAPIEILDEEIEYLIKLIDIVINIENQMNGRKKLLLVLITLDNEKKMSNDMLKKYSNNIEEYYNTYCKKKDRNTIDEYDDISILYYKCLFEYYNNEKLLNESFKSQSSIINISKKKDVMFLNMECEKYNSTFYNINIDLLKRKLKELKKLK